LLFAQAEEEPTEEELLKRKQQQEEKAAPAEEPAPETEAAPEPQPEPEAAPEPAPEPQAEPEPEPEAAPQPEPEPEAAPEPAPAPEAEQAPEPEAAPEPAPVPEAAPQPQPEPEAAPAPEPKPEAQPEPEPAPAPTPAPEAAPEPEATPEQAPAPQAAPEPEAAPTPEAKPEAPAEPEAEQPAEGEAPIPSEPPAAAPEAPAPTDGEQAPPTEGAAPTTPEAPVEGQAPAAPVDDGSAAPVLDSQKGQPAAPQAPAAAPAPEGQAEGQPAPQPAAPAAPAEAGPPPADDRAAQQAVQPTEIQPVTAEQGTRVEQQKIDLVRRERPEGTEVVKEFGDRVIIQFNNQTIVESNERPRMTRNARDVYYEDLPRGRTRETIIRDDGTRVVTIRNAYGDVIRRSRITPDDHEYVLSYVEEDNYDRVRDWRDPGLDLPPLLLEIPEDEYILTSERARDPDVYYEFLEQPPVERVERLYSIDEVKRSARIRDKTRRIDLDTVTFEFGSASIPESEISRLEGVATAMERILQKNPAETFLIEGHTDAVGSDLANLALSDKRAEAVAEALTNVFAIPPENLTTQGYGEQYLKVNTQAQERQNRRVAIRRITSLVAPVASNN
jgi:outer membrane protein OmpA-like peptidoglycan-associated protein